MSRKILLIGASSGIGLATQKLLTSQGHEVFSSSRDTFEATNPHATLELPDSLDGLVYFPGTINLKPFHRLTDEDYLADFQVNFLGATRALKLALPALKKSPAASVVLFSTIAF
ncbi:SDR family oxidoreductase, partial [Akkermansiaceae bacterium]|nr:SDR family oxidoreductase [Akkermansiaceae bacterium]